MSNNEKTVIDEMAEEAAKLVKKAYAKAYFLQKEKADNTSSSLEEVRKTAYNEGINDLWDALNSLDLCSNKSD